MATQDEQSNRVLAVINERNDLALASLSTTTSMITATRAAITNGIDDLLANGIVIDVSGVATSVDRLTGTVAPTIPEFGATRADPTLPSAPAAQSAITLTDAPAAPAPPMLPAEIGAPTLPTATGVAIGDDEWERIWAIAAGEVLQASTAEAAQAANDAVLRGMAVPVVVSDSIAALAAQRTLDRVSALAASNAIEHAKAARDDQISIGKLGIDHYTAQVNASNTRTQQEISIFESVGKLDLGRWQAYASEQRETLKVNAAVLLDQYKVVTAVMLQQHTDLSNTAREDYKARWSVLLESFRLQHEVNRGYEALQQEYEKLKLQKEIDPERLRAEYDLKKTELALVNSAGELVDLTQVNAQITNALLASSDVGLSSGTSISTSPVKYNPTSGDAVWIPS